MKKIHYIYLVMLLSLGFVSCDDFLDVKPVGKVIPSTYQDFREVLTDAYKNLPTDRAMSTMRGDELVLKKGYGDSYLRYKSHFLWEDIQPETKTQPFPWQQFYKVILNANQVLINGQNPKEGTPEEIAQLQGEAHLLRAYMHFNLVNLYADVYNEANKGKKAIPLATTIDIWKNYKRNTIQEVYDQIVTDIEEGIKLLNVEQQRKTINYRFSKISAYGLAARVYLYMGDWNKAKEYVKKAYEINHDLVDLNVADAPVPTHYKSVENILALEQTFTYPLRGYFNVAQKLLGVFDKDNDLRFAKYFEKRSDGYRCKLGYKIDYKVSMRTAEFYLILAEIEVRLGNLKDAKEYLKTLIKKRLTPDFYTTESVDIDGMDKEKFLQRVALERFRELACQGFRWYDLRRGGKPSLEKEFNGQKAKLEQGDMRYVVKFPKEALTANPNLRD